MSTNFVAHLFMGYAMHSSNRKTNNVCPTLILTSLSWIYRYNYHKNTFNITYWHHSLLKDFLNLIIFYRFIQSVLVDILLHCSNCLHRMDVY